MARGLQDPSPMPTAPKETRSRAPQATRLAAIAAFAVFGGVALGGGALACSSTVAGPNDAIPNEGPPPESSGTPPGSSGGTSSGDTTPTDGGGSSDTQAPAGDPIAFPPAWIDGTSCATEAKVQSWKLTTDTYVLRQSLCTNFEAPFVYLFVGATKALLVDTGTGAVDMRTQVMTLLAGKSVELVVAHSHAHGDHVGGDGAFTGKPNTTMVGTSANAVRSFFQITGTAAAAFDLGGGRVVDVLPIPGHQSAHVAFYDRTTKLLLTGDTLYPGRLYVDDWSAYRQSIPRLVAFVDAAHPVSFVLGAHIEMPKTGNDFPLGSTKHPNEHVLQLGDAELRELAAAVAAMGDDPEYQKHPHFILDP